MQTEAGLEVEYSLINTNNFERKHNHECWNHGQQVWLAMKAFQIKHVRHRNTARHDEGYQTME